MEYFQIKNWNKFQHFGGAALSGGVPPWIKLYVSLLDDYLFFKLTDLERCHLILLWLLAARLHNRIPNDPAWIKHKLNATEDMNLTIQKLFDYGFLENVTEINSGIYRVQDTPYTENEEDPNTVSHRREEIRREEIREEEIRREEGIRPPAHKSHKVIVTEVPEKLNTESFKTAWDKWLSYRREMKKPLTATSQEAALKQLEAFGQEIAEQAIIQSISNGWQGLFPEKINQQAPKNGKPTKPDSTEPHWSECIDRDYYRTHKKERL